MGGNILSFTDFKVPDDFSVAPFEATYNRVITKFTNSSYKEFLHAWLGIPYRFLACTEHDMAFRASIQRAGNNPPRPEHYVQDRELFGFFITGLSAIECCYYGLHAVGNLLNAKTFPMGDEPQKKVVDLKKTVERFKKAFPDDKFHEEMGSICSMKQYLEWNNIRNVLAHRLLPGRTVFLTMNPASPSRGKVLWKDDIELDAYTTSLRRAWLAKTLNALLVAADGFTQRHL
ncbi:MAG TPA: hypothetical protein VGE45_09655 [Chloroflexia bacterium]|jgi:hypothetical protein